MRAPRCSARRSTSTPTAGRSATPDGTNDLDIDSRRGSPAVALGAAGDDVALEATASIFLTEVKSYLRLVLAHAVNGNIRLTVRETALLDEDLLLSRTAAPASRRTTHACRAKTTSTRRAASRTARSSPRPATCCCGSATTSRPIRTARSSPTGRSTSTATSRTPTRTSARRWCCVVRSSPTAWSRRRRPPAGTRSAPASAETDPVAGVAHADLGEHRGRPLPVRRHHGDHGRRDARQRGLHLPRLQDAGVRQQRRAGEWPERRRHRSRPLAHGRRGRLHRLLPAVDERRVALGARSDRPPAPATR